MLKIKDLNAGSNVSIDLLVKDAQPKLTKGKKKYLDITFFDGADDINGKRWDWDGNKMPEKNMVLTVSAGVTEWAGKPQLNITAMRRNHDIGVEAFAPTGNVDTALYVEKFKSLVGELSSETVVDLLEKMFHEHLNLWETVPAAKSVHHAYVAGTLQHSVDVALKVRALIPFLPPVNRDLCIAGALLHDVGKLWSYRLDGAVIDNTDDAELLDHITIGILKLEELRTADNAETVKLLQHILASHHGSLEHGAIVTPRFMEAWVVHLMDMLDAKGNTIETLNSKVVDGNTKTAKEWTLDNRAMFTQDHVDKLVGR